MVSQSIVLTGQTITYEDLYTQAAFDAVSINTGLPVGATGGSADVSNGTSSYIIPLQIPAGTNSVAPNISLVYSSQGGDGHFGYGWNMTGISTISRGLHTMYHDGKSQGVKFTAEDKFILDGSRLIKSTGNTYVKENHDYSTIEQMGSFGSGPAWFRIETKQGVVMEVGKTSSSKLLTDDGSEIIFWKVSRVIYKDGNYIDFYYANNNRDHRISEIRYTGNSVSGINPNNRILFKYKDRGFTSNKTFEGEASVNLITLVDEIEIIADNNELVKKYELTYATDQINAFLKEVAEVGSGGERLNPTIFKYGDFTSEFTYDFVGYHPVATTDVYTGDFNGDGYSDKLVANIVEEDDEIYHDSYTIYTKVATPNNDNFFLKFTENLQGQGKLGDETGQYNFYSGDFTGEGRDDVVYAFSTEVNNDKIRLIGEVELHKMAEGAESVSKEVISFPSDAKEFFWHQNKALNTGDLNGDGVMDIVMILCDFVFDLNGSITLENYEAYIYYGNISTQFEKVELVGTSTLDIEDWGVRNINIIDIDGDGKNELMVTSGLFSEIYEFDGDEVRSINGNALGYPTQYHLMFFGDFNGDRKTDVLTRTDLNNQGAGWTVGRSTGKGFVEDPGFFTWISSQPDIDENYEGELLLIGDYNGDGRSDIARGVNYQNDQQIQFYFSRGEEWYYEGHTVDENADNNTYGVQDFNGDGRTDLMNRSSGSSGITKVLKYKPQGEDMLLTNVKNGHGHVTTFGYTNMTRVGQGYTRTEFQSHPTNNIIVPMQLPTTLKKDGYATIKYEYTNAKLHKEGRGLLGFEKIKTSALDGTNMNEEVNFVLDEDHMVMLPETIVRKKQQDLLNTRTIEHTLTDFTAVESGIDYYTHHITGTIDDNVFEGTTKVSSTIYDAYGNPTNSSLNINGIETRNTITTYGEFGSPIPSSPLTIFNNVSRSGSSSVQQKYEVLTYNTIGQLETHTINPELLKSTVTTYTYDLSGNVNSTSISAQNEETKTSLSVYDAKGKYIETAMNTLGQESSATYDAKWGKPLTTTGVDGLTRTYQYDGFGRLMKIITPQGYEINEFYEWETGSNIYSHRTVKPGDGDITKFFDALDRIRKKEKKGYGQTSTTTIDYNSRGLKTTEILPSGFTTSYIYDDYNRPITITNDFGVNTMTYAYTNGQLEINVTNPAGQESSSKKDATGKVIESTDYGGTQTYIYHSNGSLEKVTKDDVVMMALEYDLFGMQTKLTDVNAGVLTYHYNAWGNLSMETNAKGEETIINYDKLNQVLTREAKEGTTAFTYYDSGPEINQIESITGFEGDIESFTYDEFGRLESKNHLIDGISNVFSYTYDQFNHIESKTFPSGYVLNYTYNTEGYLETIMDGGNTQTVYENVSMTAMDLPATYKSIINGETQTTSLTYNHTVPTTIQSGAKVSHTYTWDFASGNLINRSQTYTGFIPSSETFTYDNLNRLKTYAANSDPTLTMNYTPNGNVRDKSDVGTMYTYYGDQINAVTGILGADYSSLSMYNQYIKFNSFEQPEIIKEHGHELNITYNSDYQRIKSQLLKNDGSSTTRYYFGDYETVNEGGNTIHLHYVNIGRGLHMIIKRENGTDQYYRTMTDYQGSIMYLGDTNGDEYYFNFDAWGRRRDAGSLTYISNVPSPSWFNRGYTGHEHLDDFQIINMNGRLYDPVIARMLSPDNNVQLPFNTQNYNRYTYAFNNPLRYTDPDGEIVIPAILVAVIKAAAIGVAANGINNVVNHRPFFDGAGKAALFGAIGGALSSAIGSVASQLPYETLGDKISVAIFQSVGHSWTGAVFSMAQGGDPLSGYVGGGLSSVVGSGFGSINAGSVPTLITGSLSGGIGSKLAGGNFWLGIGQGLITVGLNHLEHELLSSPDDFIYLMDKQGVGNIGVGHSALLIQDINGVWYFISKAGGNKGGKANVDYGGEGREKNGYSSPEEFYNSPEGQRYENRQRVSVSLSKSQKILDAVKVASETKYRPLINNCDHMCQVAMSEIGFKAISRVPIVNYEQYQVQIGNRNPFFWIGN